MPEISPLRPGDPPRIGPYLLTGRLGSGGQGTVYHATGPSGEPVAVKWIRSDLTGEGADTPRFLREVASAQRVAPFCTAQILDTGVELARPYIVSEYIDGPSLQQRVTADGPIRGNALHRLAIGTATALAAIHRAGIVHRDFKPPNVLMGPDGVRVIDFGISRALDASASLTSAIVGTPAYMAPEQFLDQHIGPATDMFAWAGTIVFAATGDHPFGSEPLPAVINRILNTEPEIRDVEGTLRVLVGSCFDKNPADRPTAQQVIDALLEQAGTGAAPPETVQTRAWPRPVPTPVPAPLPAPVPTPPPTPASTAPPPRQDDGPATRVKRTFRPGTKMIAAASAGIVGVGVGVFVLSQGRGDDPDDRTVRAQTSLSASPEVSVPGIVPVTGDGTPAAADPGASTPTPNPTRSGAVPAAELTEVKLPGTVGPAVFYDHPEDTASLASYSVADGSGNITAYARKSRGAEFEKWSNYTAVDVSLDGEYAIGIPRSFHGLDNYVDVTHLKTGRTGRVLTVPAPESEAWAHWSRDSRRVLLTRLKKKGDEFVSAGFIVIDAIDKTVRVVKIDDPSVSRSIFGWDGEQKGVVALFDDGKTKGLRFYSAAGKVRREIPDVVTSRNEDGFAEARNLFTPSGDSFVAFCATSLEKVCVRDVRTGREKIGFSSECVDLFGWYDDAVHVACRPPRTAQGSLIVLVNLSGDTVRTLVYEATPADGNSGEVFPSFNYTFA
ncbi:protein kinase domain-containing protein [Sphaerimonospora sp. CA-214678]|uniref:serine/threonine protein kinase n=1 Tax=Sphaerimonospora sp. CA-214678 TaxID=3240029 RepID=UPI003D8E11E7